jgi:hypothetical protein
MSVAPCASTMMWPTFSLLLGTGRSGRSFAACSVFISSPVQVLRSVSLQGLTFSWVPFGNQNFLNFGLGHPNLGRSSRFRPTLSVDFQTHTTGSENKTLGSQRTRANRLRIADWSTELHRPRALRRKRRVRCLLPIHRGHTKSHLIAVVCTTCFILMLPWTARLVSDYSVCSPDWIESRGDRERVESGCRLDAG